MKAIILAGGKGTRLSSVTKGIPKSLIRVGEKTLLAHISDFLQMSGVVSDVAVIANEKEKRFFDEWRNEREASQGIMLFWEKDRGGTFGCLREIKEWVQGEDFIVTNGDCLFDFNLETLTRFSSDREELVFLPLLVNMAPGRYMVVKTQGNKVIGLDTKNVEKGVVVSAGPYVFRGGIFRQDNGQAELNIETDIFPKLIAEKKIAATRVSPGFCIDCGTPESFRQASVSQEILQRKYF